MRLGGPNFHEIPINRPVAPVHNNQRDGLMRQTINTGQGELRAQLDRRRLSRCRPARATGGFVSFPERIDGAKVRGAVGEVLRPLQPGHALLQQPVRAGEGPHRRGAALRARQGRARRDPRADGRAARARSMRRSPRAWRRASAFPRTRRSSCPSTAASRPTGIRRRTQPAPDQERDRPIGPAQHGQHGQGHDRARGRSRSSPRTAWTRPRSRAWSRPLAAAGAAGQDRGAAAAATLKAADGR